MKRFCIGAPRFDLEEQSTYVILSARTASALTTQVNAAIEKVMLQEVADGPSRGREGRIVGNAFYAQRQFHQAVILDKWQEVEHQLSERAQQVETLLKAAGPEGMSPGELAAQLNCSVQQAARAAEEIPHAVKKVRPSDRRFVFKGEV